MSDNEVLMKQLEANYNAIPLRYRPFVAKIVQIEIELEKGCNQ